jgi:hypothetical protein
MSQKYQCPGFEFKRCPLLLHPESKIECIHSGIHEHDSSCRIACLSTKAGNAFISGCSILPCFPVSETTIAVLDKFGKLTESEKRLFDKIEPLLIEPLTDEDMDVLFLERDE